MNENKIIYIAGYGRSGSTLLERILSSHEKIFGVGELRNFLDLIGSQDSYCSCGRGLHECEFWSNVIGRLSGELENVPELKCVQNKLESFSGFLGYTFGHSSYKRAIYRKFTQRLFNSISQNVPDAVSYIVDSSKTAHRNLSRPIALSKISSLNIKLIHLVRDGRGCMWSKLKGDNRRMEKGLDPHTPFAALRSAAAWPIANTAAHIFQSMHSREQYCMIKYEELVERPAETLAKLDRFLDINFDQQIEMLRGEADIPLGHQLSGNRLRFQEKIILRLDVEWRSRLRFQNKLLFWLVDWPWGALYGYKPGVSLSNRTDK